MYKSIRKIAIQSTALQVKQFFQLGAVAAATQGAWTTFLRLDIDDPKFYAEFNQFSIGAVQYNIKLSGSTLTFLNQSNFVIEAQTFAFKVKQNLLLATYGTWDQLIGANAPNLATAPYSDPTTGPDFNNYCKVISYPKIKTLMPGHVYRKGVFRYNSTPRLMNGEIGLNTNYLGLKGSTVRLVRFRPIPLVGTPSSLLGFPTMTIPYYQNDIIKWYEDDANVQTSAGLTNPPTLVYSTAFGKTYETEIPQAVSAGP